jgi:hypothetical protein
MVVYDTGSDWLTVKSCITDTHCHMGLDQEATLEKLADAIEEHGLDPNDVWGDASEEDEEEE